MKLEWYEQDNNQFTPEQLRKYPGLEHLTDEEALEDIETLEKLAAILLEFNSSRKNCSNEQGLAKGWLYKVKPGTEADWKTTVEVMYRPIISLLVF